MAVANNLERGEQPLARDIVRVGGRDIGRWPVFHMLFMLLSAVVVANGLIALGTVNFKVNTETAVVAGTPITRFVPTDPDAPRFQPVPLDTKAVVVIAHGFAGSQQLMWPFASSFARNGYTAVTLDFPGNGANGTPFTLAAAQRQQTLQAVVADTRARFPGKPLVLLGHSMGSAAVVAYAATDPNIAATIAVSLVAPVEPQLRNLLVLTGEWEGDGIKTQSLAAMAERTGATDPDAFVDGTASELIWVPRAEHLLVLWSGDAQREAVQWVDRVVGAERLTAIITDVRMPGMLVVVLGTVWFWWSLCYFIFPRREMVPLGTSLLWRPTLLIGLVAAVLTPLILRFVPTSFIPITVGGYVALHFCLYGLLLVVSLQLGGIPPLQALRRTRWLQTVGGTYLLVGFVIISLGIVTHAWWLNMIPPIRRVPWAFIIFALLLPFFVGEAWLTAGGTANRATKASLAIKVLFVLSLIGAVVLNANLGFVLFIIPIVVVTFLLFGLMGERITRRIGNPLPAALAQAALLAWLIAVSFPITR